MFKYIVVLESPVRKKYIILPFFCVWIISDRITYHCKIAFSCWNCVVVEIVKETSICIGINLVLRVNIRNRKNRVWNRKDWQAELMIKKLISNWTPALQLRYRMQFTLRSGNTGKIFFFNLSCNIVAVQVETLCCAYYHLQGQLVSQQNIMLQVEATCCEK